MVATTKQINQTIQTNKQTKKGAIFINGLSFTYYRTMDPVGRILPNLCGCLPPAGTGSPSPAPDPSGQAAKGARVVIHLIADDKVGVKGVRDTIEGLPAGTKRLILVVGQQLTPLRSRSTTRRRASPRSSSPSKTFASTPRNTHGSLATSSSTTPGRSRT